MLNMLMAWQTEAAKLKAGEITKEEYDTWRYNYPKFDTTQKWANVPLHGLSNFIVDTLNES